MFLFLLATVGAATSYYQNHGPDKPISYHAGIEGDDPTIVSHAATGIGNTFVSVTSLDYCSDHQCITPANHGCVVGSGAQCIRTPLYLRWERSCVHTFHLNK